MQSASSVSPHVRSRESAAPDTSTLSILHQLSAAMQLPASLFAYRKQQHRWTCGPVALWRKTSGAIFQAAIPWHRKLEIFLIVFGVQKFLCHWVNFGFYCVLVPLSVFTPEVCAAWVRKEDGVGHPIMHGLQSDLGSPPHH